MKSVALLFAGLLVFAAMADVTSATPPPWNVYQKVVTVDEDTTRVFGWSFRAGEIGSVTVVGDDGSQLEVSVYDGKRLIAKSAAPADRQQLYFVASTSTIYTFQVHNVGLRPSRVAIQIEPRGS